MNFLILLFVNNSTSFKKSSNLYKKINYDANNIINNDTLTT